MQNHSSREFIGERHSNGCLDKFNYRLDVVRAAGAGQIEHLQNDLQFILYILSNHLLLFVSVTPFPLQNCFE